MAIGIAAQSSKRKSLMAAAYIALAATFLMSATTCQEEPKQRELRRRVQLGKVTAPSIPLQTGQGSFDFQYAANAQMWTVLKKTQAFTQATIDPAKVYDPSGLDQDLASSFLQCEEPEALESIVNVKIKGVSTKAVMSQKAACMINVPNGLIAGGISNFQLYNGGAIKFDLLGTIKMLEFEFDSYVMTANMQAFKPIVRNQALAATTQNNYSNNLKVGVGLNFGTFGTGLSAYFKSNLSSVVEDGLVKSLEDLKTQWNTVEPWYGMVLKNCDKYVYLSGGGTADVNLMPGDILRLTNVQYLWSGNVCSSYLQGTVESKDSVGYARVVRVGDTISVAELIENDPKYPMNPSALLYPGARAYLEKLYVAPKTAAKASVGTASK